MNGFDNLSLRGKLLLNFLVSGGVLIVAIVFCLFQIHLIGKDTEEIAGNWLPSIENTAEISQLRLRYRVRSLEYMLPGSAADKEKIEKSLADLDKELSASLARYEPLISSDEEKKAYQAAVSAAAGYKATVEEAIALVKAGKEDEAQQMRKSAWTKQANLLRDQTDLLQKLNREGADASSISAQENGTLAERTGIGALLLGSLLAFFFTVFISGRIAGRLSLTVDATRRIADGDLTGALPPASRDEVGRMIEAMGTMQASLRGAMRETVGSAQAILDSSQQLNATTAKMNQSADIQSATASAISANVEELTVSINVVAESTGEAASLAATSDTQAADGRRAIELLISQINDVATVVRTAAGQMSELNSESKKISGIVEVIKDIAGQTNLLALNAAIEAARAGEHGRGFAVVADEVRSLSERTTRSTGEISQMVVAIQQSTEGVVAGVGRGVDLVDSSVAIARDAGEAIGRLQEMAQRVAQVIGDVNVALHEQSAASNEVAKKIEDVASQAEGSSAIAHATSTAADSMTATARGMQALVARFRV
ncbi:methyl-accepting chemotaxis protein [Rhodocyclus tenuis]|uniref:Methyl-accepting chemotaxis protein n=1 Tax=Rhodocyclus tenuis TaxID=1066 RepID=A0A840GEJ7_RHOTE|nr:methyl-accepting chemotaxis protein [Rhodocyclus tenuis]MBB4249058.1 methyl-accepting chemotaxis protein [Rhodocyclus tenuis]